MATTRTPRSEWIDAGLRALADGGPEAVRVEPLARALGVTKGGFYWHFKDRRALLDEMLDTWEDRLVDEAIRLTEAGRSDARARLRRLFALATDEAVQVDLAVRDWARRDPAVAQRLRRVDNRRMDYLRSQFGAFVDDGDEVEVRCVLAISLWIGNHFIAVDHGGRSPTQVMRLVQRRLLA
ncbi:MAG TPA: TetR/AcrR family transcriptional regulator [Aquihabitans sp.]|nr:TetR/AcrR family transcriptional regulator [Aquihabitans sp.]